MTRLSLLLVSTMAGCGSYIDHPTQPITKDGSLPDMQCDISTRCSLFGAPCLTIDDCCTGTIKVKCLAGACSPDIPVIVSR